MRHAVPIAAALVAVTMGISSCGLMNPDYKPYDYVPSSGGDTGDGTDGADGTGECAAGSQLTGFQTNVAGAVNATCSGAACHANMSKMQLVKDQDDANRQKLLTYSAGDAATFSAFLHSTNHKGGNMASVLPAASIEAWLGIEAKCK